MQLGLWDLQLPVMDGNRHKQDVNAIDDIEIDVNTLA
jgi:hypothetical protein